MKMKEKEANDDEIEEEIMKKKMMMKKRRRRKRRKRAGTRPELFQVQNKRKRRKKYSATVGEMPLSGTTDFTNAPLLKVRLRLLE